MDTNSKLFLATYTSKEKLGMGIHFACSDCKYYFYDNMGRLIREETFKDENSNTPKDIKLSLHLDSKDYNAQKFDKYEKIDIYVYNQDRLACIIYIKNNYYQKLCFFYDINGLVSKIENLSGSEKSVEIYNWKLLN